MKRLLFFSCLLAGLLLWPLLFAQKTNPNPDQIRVDSLLAQKQYAAAIPLLEQLRQTSEQVGAWGDFQTNTIKLAQALALQEKFPLSDSVLTQGLAKLNAAGQGETNLAAGLWLWKARYIRKLERYPDVLEGYRTAIRIYEKNHFNGKDLAFCYKNAAQVLMRWMNYDQADDYLRAALNSDSTKKYQLSFFAQMTANAYWRDSLELAFYYFQTGQQLPVKDDLIDLPAKADLELTGALILTKTGRLDEADQLAQRALAYFDTIPKEGENRLRSLTALADIAARRGRVREAEDFFRRAEAEGQKKFEGKKSREMAKLYTEMGDFHAQNAQTELALQFYQKAIVQAFPAFNDLNPAVNPPLDAVPLESWAMWAPARKAVLLLRKDRPDAPTRQNAAECFRLAFAASAELRRVYGADEAKLYLARYNQNIRREAALNLWALYHETPDQPADVLAQLLVLLEDTRAAALRDALQQQRALALSGVPDSLLRQEEMLRFQIADAITNLQDAQKEKDHDPIAIEAANNRVFQCERRHAELLDDLQTSDPQLARYTRQTPQVDPIALRAALADSSGLLSWFDAGDRYLCVVVRRDGLSGFEVLRDSVFDRRLSDFLGLLADKSAQENAPDGYFTEAFALGRQLLPGSGTAGLRQLIIVPDGRLCFLPFEALLTAPYQGNFGNAPYLIRSHTVRYAWSATLLTIPPAQLGQATKGVLHLAPFVETARDGLAPLANSGRERPSGGTVTALLGPAATAAAFLDKARAYNVLQLSTHAHAGGKTQPGIELYDRTLQLPEIYAQRLPAALVALSACETGTGEYAEGEGVLSLARAFAYAGAESLVASLWTVNERSTAELFTQFYQKLEGRMSRAEALRQAKLDWLNGREADARKAPWYWAAFTLSGGDGPVDISGRGGWSAWWLGLLLVGAVGAAVLWRRRKT